MGRTRIILLYLIIILIVGSLILFPSTLTQHFYLFSFILLAVIFLPFIIRFERRKVNGREIVLLAVLSAVAAVSRIPFASIPNVQPTTFVVIMSGYVFGPESGFLVGATAALVSNLFLGQGPWTPWQMLAWGIIGFLSGVLKKTGLPKSKLGLCSFGFISGYFYGLIMNIWLILSMVQTLSFKGMLLLYSGSFYFDTAHALTNVILLYFFGSRWIKILTRFKKKYGLLEG